MTNEIAKTNNPPPQTLSRMISQESVKEFARKALGGVMDVELFLTQLAITFHKPELAVCTVDSQIKAVNACASLGLLPSLRQIAIIPRKEGAHVVATVMPEYRGYIALIKRDPDVADVVPHLVHKNDEYEIENRGPDGAFIKSHTFDPLAKERTFKNLDDLKGGYVVIKMRDGSEKHHFVHVESIKKAKDCAQTKNVWNSWPEEQALKTLIRNTFNRNVVHLDFAASESLTRMGELEDEAHGNNPNLVVVTSPSSSTTQVSRASQLLGKLNGDPVDDEPVEDVAAEEQKPVDRFKARIAAAENQEDLEAIAGDVELTLSEKRLTKAENEVLQLGLSARLKAIG